MTTKLEKIMDLLANDELTSIEIALKLEIPVSNCSSYLNTLMNDKRIIRTTDKRPYKYKLAIPLKELLKQLYNLMSNKCEIREIEDSDIILLETIKEIVK